ncbi:MAG: hypothetical protein GY953_29535 [bacterium]|nr:hypothetical protein [bacterium]
MNPELSKRLVEARLECHHAAQFMPRFARAFVESRPDDSHTAMQWDSSGKLLVSEAVSSSRLGLRLRDLTLVLGGEFPLGGRTVAEAIAWLETRVSSLGLDPAALSNPLHYEIPAHPVASGEKFNLEANRMECEELEHYFANAANAIAGVAGSSPVLCWPHHFDIAALITLSGSGENARTIGAGLSPGDGSYSQPYFYVSPWPAPPAEKLPVLATGAWHTTGWVGAVLLAEEFAGKPGLVERFLAGAVDASRSLLAA